jgi:hypothetical protein
MSLRNWSKYHTYGLIIGFLGPLIYIPLTMLIIAQVQNFHFERLWDMFFISKSTQGKFISLSIIPNLAWFYIFLNKENFGFAMGIILGSVLYFPYIVYVNFF